MSNRVLYKSNDGRRRPVNIIRFLPQSYVYYNVRVCSTNVFRPQKKYENRKLPKTIHYACCKFEIYRQNRIVFR